MNAFQRKAIYLEKTVKRTRKFTLVHCKKNYAAYTEMSDFRAMQLNLLSRRSLQ